MLFSMSVNVLSNCGLTLISMDGLAFNRTDDDSSDGDGGSTWIVGDDGCVVCFLRMLLLADSLMIPLMAVLDLLFVLMGILDMEFLMELPLLLSPPFLPVVAPLLLVWTGVKL